MKIHICENPQELGKAAGREAAESIKAAINTSGTANIILATGTSQYETLLELIAHTDIDWSGVVMFHLDEYIGLSDTAPASFRKYLRERFLEKVPALKAVYLIDGEADPETECKRLSRLITDHPIDVALVGIGENGHLAFNDPPADFQTEEPYIIVELDEACRRQQLGEGWFPTIESVPSKAISMSIQQIMKSSSIICSVPDARKADAVAGCFNSSVSNLHPASILQQHDQCSCYLDRESSSKLYAKHEYFTHH
jgi:glucosamine-6-phosphate deaminase